MVLTSVFDFHGGETAAVYSDTPEPLQADSGYLIANWTDPTRERALLALAERWGSRLLVPEAWRLILPQAGLLISSAISGGDLRQRFQEASGRRCWLLQEPMRMVFPLPCPSGQGTPVLDIPQTGSFYSKTLGCRYIHEPDRVILFDTEETMAQKRRLAEQCGFCGYLPPNL